MNLEKMYTIYKDKYGKYSVKLNKKNQKEEWESAFFPVHFRKDVEIKNKTKMYIKDCWLDFNNWEHEGKKGTSFYFFINDFEIIEQPKEEVKENKPDPYAEMGQQVSIDQYEITDEENLELPF